MKIAYMCADPGIPVLGNKGASVHVREFTDALVELGHQVQIFSAAGTVEGESSQSPNATRAGLTVLPPSERIKEQAGLFAAELARLDPKRDHRHLHSELIHLLADSEFIHAARPQLQEFDPDLIIARHTLMSTAGTSLARALRRPCVLEVNAPLVEERLRYWNLTFLREAEDVERMAFAGADLLVAVSEGVRAYLLRYGAPRERILVMPNGVNVANFHPEVSGSEVRRRYNLDGKLVIGFAGSLKPWHGVDLLMKAFASIRNILGAHDGSYGARLRLLIIGDGPQREQLMQLSHALDLDEAVTFTGAVSHDEMPAHLAALDIAVAPYLSSDGFYFSPLKIMEYLAMGLPVVAPRLGQIPSLLQNGKSPCGLIYPPDDQHELTSALLTLINSESLRRQLGERAAAQARLRSSWQGIARQIIERVSAPRRVELRELESVQQ